MIKLTSNKVKTCCKCRDNIYTFEIRRNRNSGATEHLQCDFSKLHQGSLDWIMANFARI